MPTKQSWYSWSLRILVLAAVAWVVIRNFNETRHYDFDFNWPVLSLGFISVCAGYLGVVLIWISLTGVLGLHVPVLKAAKAWCISQLGKYVPGKVALLLVRFDAYQGYPKRLVAIATWIEYIVSLGAAGVLILLALATAPQLVPVSIRWTAGIGTVLFLSLLWPPWLMSYVNGILTLFRKEPIDIELLPSYPVLLRYVGAYLLAGLLHGLGFFLVIRSLFPVEAGFFLTIAGAYEAAGVIGLAAVFAPSGIGVREGVLFIVLPLFLPMPVVIVSVILIRLVMTAAELTLSGFVTVLENRYGTGE